MKLVVSLVASVAALATLSISTSALAAEKSCMMSRAVGVTEGEAQAFEDIVCQTVHEQAPAGATHWVKVSGTNGRYVLTLVQERAGVVTEKQAVLQGIDELPVAAPRLVEALAEDKRLADTQTVTNIIAQEARTPKKKASEIHAGLGVVGVGAMTGGAQGGAQFSLTVGSPQLSFVGDLRLAGDVANDLMRGFTLGIVDPSAERSLGFAAASSGARHHFSDKDFSPFVGAGLALEAISLSGEGRSTKNTGVAGYLEVGLDVLRTNTLGGTIALRADAPTFELKGTQRLEDGKSVPARAYTPIVAAAFSLRF
jgi:hypothetical protein